MLIRLSRLGGFAIAVALLAPWVLVFSTVRSARTGTGQQRHAAAAATSETIVPSSAVTPPRDARPPRGRVGPWGQLDLTRIFIEPPDDFILPAFTTPRTPQWFLGGYSGAQLNTLWDQVGLSTTQRAVLVPVTRRTAEGLIITPPAELILELSPQTRALLYAALAAFPENAPQRDPFRCRDVDATEWFDRSGLPAEIVTLAEKLLYRRHKNLLLSDHDLLLPRLADGPGRIELIKTLARKSALLAELRVEANADVESLARYWGQGRRSKDIKPLLQSLADRPNGGSVDLVHLLPPFPRLLLYTYPLPSDRPADGNRDCHWTSFNFYHDPPDDRFTDIALVQQTLVADYFEAGGEPTLGDIIVLLEPGGRAVHSCVYVADEVVFTKNGSAFSVPWTLAALENVVAFYSLNEPLETRRYRLKAR